MNPDARKPNPSVHYKNSGEWKLRFIYSTTVE